MAKKVKSNDLIKVDNRFTQMHFKYTQEEMDILFYVMSIVRDDITRDEFSVSDMEEISGKTIQRNRFRDSITRLGKRPYEITHSEDRWKTIFIFRSIEYDCGIDRVSHNDEMIPILCDLKKNYTKLQLASGFRLNGKYSKRLYMLLCRWRNKGGMIYEIDDLMETIHFQMEDSGNRITWFKQMIARAVSDINENTDIFVETEWLKTGRKTTHINFKLRKGKLKAQELDILTDPEYVRMQTMLMPCGVPEKLIERLYSEGCTFKMADDVRKKATQAIINGTVVANPGAYLIQCFKNRGFLKDEVERAQKIAVYRDLISNGTPLEMLKPLLEREGIFAEEVL